MAEHRIQTPVSDQVIEKLRAGDKVFISGYLLTGRDAAHKKLIDLIKEGKELPVDVKGQLIYYVGPDAGAAGKGHRLGRTDDQLPHGLLRAHAPRLRPQGHHRQGVAEQGSPGGVEEAQGCLPGGRRRSGGLISKSIVGSEVVAYPELGPEAIIRLKVKDFPCIVINDMYGGDLYEEGKKKYRIE